MTELYRHGDVLIQKIEGDIPKSAKKREGNILSQGIVTGHTHTLTDLATFQIYEDNDMLYIDVVGEQTTIEHQEHDPIALTQGQYKVWTQREYTPQATRRVID